MRSVARTVLRYFAPIYVAAIVVQILLAGEGILGVKKGVKLDTQKSLDPHGALGFILAVFGAIVLLILALIAWHPDKRIRRVTIALPFMLFVQGLLGGGNRIAGTFHPLFGFVVLGTLGWLAHRLWRPAGRDAAPSAVPTG